MFQPIDSASGEATLRLTFDGQPVVARPGDTVAAALIAAGIHAWREAPRTGALRGPFCMMGACYDCMVVIDGQPNRQACMTAVADGMVVTLQKGSGE